MNILENISPAVTVSPPSHVPTGTSITFRALLSSVVSFITAAIAQMTALRTARTPTHTPTSAYTPLAPFGHIVFTHSSSTCCSIIVLSTPGCNINSSSLMCARRRARRGTAMHSNKTIGAVVKKMASCEAAC
ncbi:hypothetical protein BV25DRAFT_1821393 [Artomyces pyxidatus]|uniref:Uncharacterized protein n=1 Tax=Artomyces pyxidatus TaxID=48021 RepID=A0ACB8TBC6_9AGAM|nr:hypothetical protein BV25DRAFT_1821393 [Artomyces pyxidatus]